MYGRMPTAELSPKLFPFSSWLAVHRSDLPTTPPLHGTQVTLSPPVAQTRVDSYWGDLLPDFCFVSCSWHDDYCILLIFLTSLKFGVCRDLRPRKLRPPSPPPTSKLEKLLYAIFIHVCLLLLLQNNKHYVAALWPLWPQTQTEKTQTSQN